MKRWGVCKMLEVSPGEWEPAIAAHQCWWRIIHLGSPTWVICQFGTQSLTTIAADNNIKIFPELTMDSLWSSLNAATRNKAINELQAAGFATSGIKASSTMREVLNYVCQQIDPSANVEAGYVRDFA